MDVKLHRDIKIGELNGKFYIRIQNLTDRRNQISVYGDSGKANQNQVVANHYPITAQSLPNHYHHPAPKQLQNCPKWPP